MYIYIYIYIVICVYIYIYIYMCMYGPQLRPAAGMTGAEIPVSVKKHSSGEEDPWET